MQVLVQAVARLLLVRPLRQQLQLFQVMLPTVNSQLMDQVDMNQLARI